MKKYLQKTISICFALAFTITGSSAIADALAGSKRSALPEFDIKSPNKPQP